MARYEATEPLDIGDRLLWRDAQRLLTRHAEANRYGHCAWCGDEWPCAPRRLAERGQVAARRPWPDPRPDDWPQRRHDPWHDRWTDPWHGSWPGAVESDSWKPGPPAGPVSGPGPTERSRWSDLIDYASPPR